MVCPCAWCRRQAAIGRYRLRRPAGPHPGELRCRYCDRAFMPEGKNAPLRVYCSEWCGRKYHKGGKNGLLDFERAAQIVGDRQLSGVLRRARLAHQTMARALMAGAVPIGETI